MSDRVPHVARVRVRYEETDQMGVVYHANYLRYFEVGRTEMLRDLGLTYRSLEADGVFLAVIEAACRYHEGARYDDMLVVETLLSAVGNVRVRFDYTIRRDDGPTRLVTGHTVLACLGTDRRPRRLSEALTALLGP